MFFVRFMLKRSISFLKKKIKRKIINRKLKPKNLVLEDSVILPKKYLITNPVTQIGRGTVINGTITIHGKGCVTIGRYCAIGSELRIITSNHKICYPNIQIHLQRRMGFTDNSGDPQNVNIGSASWIGDRVTFTPGSSVGVGCIVGAGSVVTKSFPDFSIIAGNPAKILRKRFNDSIAAQLVKIRWWDWPEERIKNNKLFFNTNLATLTEKNDLYKLIKS